MPFPGIEDKNTAKLDRCIEEVLEKRNFTPKGVDPQDVNRKKQAAIAICRSQLGL